MQVVGDLRGDVGEASLVDGVAGGHVVERRAHARAPGVADEVAAVGGIVAEVVEVLEVGGRDGHLVAAVGRRRRCVERRVGAGRERRRLHLDAVLLEREVEAADGVVVELVEDPDRRQQRGRVPARGLDAERRQHDAVAVAVVEQWLRLVVERVRVAEHPPRVGVGAGGQRVVGPDQPHLAVGRRGEDVAAAGGDAAARDQDPLALVALPVAVGVGQVGRGCGLGDHDVGVGIEPGGGHGRRAGGW